MLHLIFELSDCTLLSRLNNPKAIIFLNNAVFNLLKNSLFEQALLKLVTKTQCYVLNEDLNQRGIEKNILLEGIETIDYSQFVKLTIKYAHIQTWI
jgi:sulfur relay protein TusB/DsrH